MTFLSYYVPSTLVLATESMSRFQIRIDSAERLIWQQYANQHFRGNLAKMIRSMVTQGILASELDQQSDMMDEIIDLIYDIKSSSMDTTSQVESFDNDLKIMKSLLSQLVDTQLSKFLEPNDSEESRDEEENLEDEPSGGNKFDF